MKIVQSLWTRPLLQSKKGMTDALLAGGWPIRKYHYYSIVLSYLQLKKYYPSIELVTDTLGKEIIVDKLQLDYTTVTVELDALEKYTPRLWALGKIYAYKRQDVPFLHVDNDIYIWKPFDKQLCNSELIAQNRELETPGYTATLTYICKNFPYVPSYLKALETFPFIPCINAGILGGNRLDFYKVYTTEVLEFLDRNHQYIVDNIEWARSAYLSVIFEQVIYYALAQAHGIGIAYLFPEDDGSPPDIGYLHNRNKNNGFVHSMGGYKQQRIVYSLVEMRVRELYPEHYERINELMSVFEL